MLPPIIAVGLKAYLKIRPKVSGMYLIRTHSTTKSADEVENGHDGNHLFGDGAYAADASDEDENCCDAKENADCPAGIPKALWQASLMELD